MSPEQRDLLLDAYLQGTLDDQGFGCLLTLLREDPSAVKRLAELSLLDSRLVYMGREEGLLQEEQIGQLTSETDELPEIVIQDLPASGEDTATREAIRQQAERQLSSFLAEQERLRDEQRLQSQASTLDLLGTVHQLTKGFVATLSYTGRTALRLSVAAAIVLVIVASYQYAISHRKVAILEKTADAVWLDSPGQRILRPGWRELKEGYAEIQFLSGARVIVEAPSRFQLVSPRRMLLEQGTITSVVPPQAQGFTVSTKTALVKDLGTEFGVRSDASGETFTAVFKGVVELSGTDRSEQEKRRVEQNEQVLASAFGRLGQTHALDYNHGFQRSWDDVLYLPKVSGQVRALRQIPPDLRVNVKESSDWLYVFPERRGVDLTEDLHGVVIKQGSIKMQDQRAVLPAGHRVDTYMLHCDPVGVNLVGQVDFRGRIYFPRPIVGLISSHDSLVATDSLLGSPETYYNSKKAHRGVDFVNSLKDSDKLTVHANRRTLEVHVRAGAQLDQLRILIQAAPHPTP